MFKENNVDIYIYIQIIHEMKKKEKKRIRRFKSNQATWYYYYYYYCFRKRKKNIYSDKNRCFHQNAKRIVCVDF